MDRYIGSLLPRHIQDHDAPNTSEEQHWGYPSRVVPCTNDPGSCEYLKSVYWMHDVSMLYTLILWGVILGILAIWVALRGWRMGGPSQSVGTFFDKTCDSIQQLKRRWLLRDAPMKWLFARISRLQVLVLACLLVYLLIFSLVGIVYRTWITPIEDYPDLRNTRTGLGGFSDRIGALAYALTPFTILLSNRESCLSILTGINYQHFNFLHRWTGRIIFIQSFIHTLGWTVIEGRLYQPQPDEYRRVMSSMYIIFGVVAMFLLTLMLVLSTKTAIKWFGYEFFKITHWIIAILYIGACWGHWDRLWCWMVPSLALIAIDQMLRAIRTCYIHMGGKAGRFGFKAAQAEVKVLGDGDDFVVRLDFDYEHREAWKAGQHFHICFPTLSIWQSHPFTPSSSPDPRKRLQHHTYILRVRAGQTAKLAALENTTIPSILTGPYGSGHPKYETPNVLAVAGGTGVTFTLPVALEALNQPIIPRAVVDFVWIVRRAQDLCWLSNELEHLKTLLKDTPSLRISIFITRESQADHATRETVHDKSISQTSSGSSSDGNASDLIEMSSPGYNVTFLADHHPSIAEVVNDFMERAKTNGGHVEIVGSGPEELGSDLRSSVADIKSDEAVEFYWDSRE